MVKNDHFGSSKFIKWTSNYDGANYICFSWFFGWTGNFSENSNFLRIQIQPCLISSLNGTSAYFRLGWITRTFIIFISDQNSQLGKITKIITRLDSLGFTNSPYIWFWRFSWKAISSMRKILQIMKFIYRMNSLKSKNSF